MEQINGILKRSGIIKKILEVSGTDLVLCLSGAGIGEKILSLYALSCGSISPSGAINFSAKESQKVVFIARDMIELLEVKEGLDCLGASYSTLSIDLNPPLYMPIKNNTNKIENLQSLYSFYLGKTNILLVSPDSLLYKFHFKLKSTAAIFLQEKTQQDFSALIKKLVEIGYKKCEKIEKTGDFSVKGDILDIYLNNYLSPVRIDFFGDEIEDIYLFDIENMQKLEKMQKVDIYPNAYITYSDEQKNEIISNIKLSLLSTSLNHDALIKVHTLAGQVCEGLEDGIIALDDEFLMPFIKEEYSLFDIVENAKIIISEPKKVYDNLMDVHKSISASIYDFLNAGELMQEHTNYFFNPLKALEFKPNIIFSSVEQKVFNVDTNDYIRTIGSRNYTFDYKSLINDIFIYERSNYKVILFAGDENSQKSISDFLIKYNVFPSEELLNSNKFQCIVHPTAFNKSFSFLDAGIVAIGTDDLIKKSAEKVKNISTKSKKRKVFYLPKVGDFVVHETHGIGKCIALEKLNLNGTIKDYFVLEYAGGDKLYLPSEQADLISAYLGGDAEPKLNKIGGEQFAKIKEKVKQSVSKLAVNLLEIYSQREKTKGTVYAKDNYLIEEFENAFPYEETADQLSAITEIKKDMEGPKIMDRLICGDVGYGKTEVALRAIYKAVVSGKQVAFLCPTTILSEQHFSTAKKRFDGFMVNVAVLNRFKNKSQQEEILKELKAGKIDLIIGTHRLLSSDVQFKDLGLLILDEEQRFGVGDKEKIKELKKNVDVLTLSATPIPRTLNMALTGIRDISIIETPPKERIPVKTFVLEESDSVILEACKKELARGGQVLFVYNRVEHIYEQAERVRAIMPNARIGVAHGQMPEKLLEQTIMSLYNGEYDIMVATTLIESGIDLPLANTLIVLDSDRLGLSELYQLRGRIGRSDKVAYAYFMYNPSKILTSDAYKRLDAILEYTELGSGFKIAMRDLEIRGAGNILGKEQHGHLEKVGYDMYCKLLESAVKELKGEKVKEAKPIKIDITISANIPSGYVLSEDDRIKLYTDISLISSDEDFNKIKDIITQTYGEPPKDVINLLKVAYIKNLGIVCGVKRVQIDASACKIYLYKTEKIMTDQMSSELAAHSNGYLVFEDTAIVKFDFKMASVEQKMDFVLEFLKNCTIKPIKNN